MRANKTYLGDSVYAEFDGFHIVLTTENGDGPSNRIYLDPSTLDALEIFREKIYENPTQFFEMEDK